MSLKIIRNEYLDQIRKAKEEEIKSIPRSKIRLYSSPDAEFQLEKDYSDEIERKESYHGREILELLQNVDDAYQSLIENGKGKKGDKVTAYISLDNDVLTVANTGTAFNFESIKRLSVGHASQKGDRYIGNKGTGFRSVLNWAKEVEIYSDGYNFRYSKRFATACFNKIDKSKITTQLKNKPNLCLPILSVPEWIEDTDDKRTEQEKEYNTVIKIIIDVETQNDKQGVLEQLDSLDMNILLFLPNISEIKIYNNGQEKIYSKEITPIEDYEEISVYSTINKNISDKLSYAVKRDENHTIFDKDAKKNKAVNIAVAIPLNNIQDEYFLYNFFPMRLMKSPFKLLLHASFLSLDQHRDSLNLDTKGYNKQILEYLLELCVSFVSSYFSNKETDYTAFRFLTPNNYLYNNPCLKNSSLEQFDLSEKYLDLIKSTNLLPSVNGQYLSLKDEPFVAPDNLPKELNGKGFDKILCPFIYNENESYQYNFFRTLKISKMDSQLLCNEINNRNNTFSVKERVEIFCWWVEQFSGLNYCPNLLFDTHGNSIGYGKRCFYKSESTLTGSELSFTDFVYLDDDYTDALINYFDTYKAEKVQERKERYDAKKTTTKRVIPFFLRPFIDLREFTTKSVISTVNACVNDSYENSVEFVNWLWSVFPTISKPNSDEDELTSVSEKITYHFPTANKTVAASKEIYLGKDYGNELEDLFLNSDYQRLAPLSEFAFKDELLEDLIPFFKYFEVIEFPRIEKDKEPIYKLDEYRDDLWWCCKNISDNSWPTIKVSIINNVEYLLSKDTETILKWILSDKQIRTVLLNKYESWGEVKYREYNHKVDSELYPIPSYLNFVFTNSKWVSISGHGRIEPGKCLLVSNDKLLSTLHPCITNEYLEELSSHLACTVTELEEIFIAFNVKTSIADLDSDSFYDLLLKLPSKKNENRKLASKIISQCIDKDKPFYRSSKQDEFFTNGLILAKQKGEEAFFPLNEVRFSSSAVVNINNVPLLKTPPRNGNRDLIKKIFNVQPFSEKYVIDKNSISLHPDNNTVEKKLKDFLPFVYALRQQSNAKSTELNIYKNLHIYLVSNISINIDSNPDFHITEPYSIIFNKNEADVPTDNKDWYVYLPADVSLDLFEFSKNSLESIFYIIQNQMNVSSLGELFRADDYQQRLRLVEDKIDSEIIQNAITILYESSTERIKKYLETNNLLSQEILNVFNSIDFDNLKENDVPNLIRFLNLFDYTDKRFEEIYNIPTYIIKEYNEKIFRIYWNDNSDFYYLPIYESLENMSLEEKLKYANKKAELEKLIKVEVNSHIKDINFVPSDILERFCFKEDSAKIDIINGIYDSNIESLKKLITEVELFELFSTKFSSLLCFSNVIDYIQTEYNEYIKLNSQPKGKEDLVETGKKPNLSNSLVPSSYSRTISNGGFSTSPSNPTAHNPLNPLENARTGGLAELCVIETLESGLLSDVNEYFNNQAYKIKWISSYAKKYRKEKKINDAAGYDIYLSSSDKELFLEVKGTKESECSFLMSANEFCIAKQHQNLNNYWIVFVSRVKDEHPNINVIKVEDLINNNIFTSSTDTYFIQYKGIAN